MWVRNEGGITTNMAQKYWRDTYRDSTIGDISVSLLLDCHAFIYVAGQSKWVT